MTPTETMRLYKKFNCRNLIVKNIRSGAKYIVNIDIVKEQDNADEDSYGFVYGQRIDHQPTKFMGRKLDGDIKWFFLKSVRFVEPTTP